MLFGMGIIAVFVLLVMLAVFAAIVVVGLSAVTGVGLYLFAQKRKRRDKDGKSPGASS